MGAALGLPARQRLARGEVAPELLAPAAHLVVELVRVLDELLEALGVQTRKALTRCLVIAVERRSEGDHRRNDPLRNGHP